MDKIYFVQEIFLNHAYIDTVIDDTWLTPSSIHIYLATDQHAHNAQIQS